MKTTLISALAAAAGLASAHYTFPELINDGVREGYYQNVRIAGNHWSHNPVTDVTSNDMRCNSKDADFPWNATTATVNAGSKVGFYVEGGLGHPGPLLFYMARVPDTADPNSWEGEGDVWFKIQANPPTITASGPVWPEANGETEAYTVIPADTPAGNYLLRVEHIGLHGASSVGGAQLYLNCAQINVVGSGTGTPGPLVSFPGAYSAQDPGLLFQLYYPVPTEYVMPGPAIWGGGGAAADGSAPAPVASTTPSAAPSVTSVVPSVTSTAVQSVVPTVPAGNATVPDTEGGACGAKNFRRTRKFRA